MGIKMSISAWLLSFYICSYLALLVFKRERRDFFAFLLVTSLCIAFGLRDLSKLLPVQDPVIYSTLISRVMVSDVSFSELGFDYVPFHLMQVVTLGRLSIGGALLLVHLVFLLFIIPIYRYSRIIPGLFYVLSGWMIFANSGVLLLCNFLRQGYAIMFFLALILGAVSTKKPITRIGGALFMPVLHVSALIFSPVPLFIHSRRFHFIYAAVFVAGMALIAQWAGAVAPDVDNLSAASMQLFLKVLGAYILVLLALLVQSSTGPFGNAIQLIKRVSLGVVLPSAALLLLRSPALLVHALRFTYWIHAQTFLYLAAAVSSNKSEWLIRALALAFCVFGIFTWTNPNVAMLLAW